MNYTWAYEATWAVPWWIYQFTICRRLLEAADKLCTETLILTDDVCVVFKEHMTTLRNIAQRMAQDLLAEHSNMLSDKWPAVGGDPIATVLNLESAAFQATVGQPKDPANLILWFKAMICGGLAKAAKAQADTWMFFVDKPTPVLGDLINWLLSYHRFSLRIEPGVVGSYYVYIAFGVS